MDPVITPAGGTPSAAAPAPGATDQAGTTPPANGVTPPTPNGEAAPAAIDWQKKAEEFKAQAAKFQSIYDREIAGKQDTLKQWKEKEAQAKDPSAKLNAKEQVLKLERDLFEAEKAMGGQQVDAKAQILDDVRQWDDSGTALTGKEGEFISRIVQDTSPENAKIILSLMKDYRQSLIADGQAPDDGTPPSPANLDGGRPGGQDPNGGRGGKIAFSAKSILGETDPTKRQEAKGNLLAAMEFLTNKEVR
jgi:hypothetical protein